MLAFTAIVLMLAQVALCRRPNILFILTDDQDLHMESVEHMPHLKDLIVDKGTTYSQHYCTVALCCPSRATLWTGKAAHNHNVTNVSPPHGGYPKVVKEGVNDENLFIWMQEAGYNTYYTGKLWNFHTVDNYNEPYAKGFNGSDFLLDPYTYQYWNGKISHNGEEPVSLAGQYSTDVIAERAKSWLSEAIEADQPFFLTVSPIAPHSNWVIDVERDLSYLEEPKPAPRHQDLFKDYAIPRDPSFNAAIDGAVGWIKDLPELNDTKVRYNDHYQRQRLRALQSVDEMLPQLVDELEAAGQLDNTYIFYTTDNGYHISQHRMNPGKECGYDTDIHIPFFVRGPGVPSGGSIDAVTTHTDVAATILKIADIEKDSDGTSIPLNKSDSQNLRHEHAAIEYWGASDPFQTRNLAADSQTSLDYQILGRPLTKILTRLNALIMVLKTCKGRVCTHPWETLHPDGSIIGLHHAAHEQYDSFYQHQPTMWFSECPEAYIAEVENQEDVKPFTQEMIVQRPGFDWTKHWQHFT
ncbi:hypothetical protein NW762_014033 [Fusarium torreyae]|uniref:Sulfatase N-terminal domain-containing protein n=1 Tax=Fusarium torreyae TaxID=1237075 RepID=A0A9W8RMD9_9HYPO|nr:hypothetical protein NW762_014033 [Fusarium torreyae]